MAYIENIVIGKPIASLVDMFALDEEDWENVEKEKTFFTEERFLPKILVELGIYPSVSEIRRNRKDLMMLLDRPMFIDKYKVSKRRTIWILVGE